eukprot:CAMPEP_0178475238 /NCGR_PEP_ID=MMETSP0696-20121128/3011_1 /TAXON_ID=265572 /ORGANISM="Extubocellulus spinifer, Strain CCMP396" /LENGTH=695 /DNA_ID=CAMNT_0020102509 /DNA_START=304 /DNA_END=2392 /DNA_ORIENTATION=-
MNDSGQVVTHVPSPPRSRRQPRPSPSAGAAGPATSIRTGTGTTRTPDQRLNEKLISNSASSTAYTRSTTATTSAGASRGSSAPSSLSAEDRPGPTKGAIVRTPSSRLVDKMNRHRDQDHGQADRRRARPGSDRRERPNTAGTRSSKPESTSRGNVHAAGMTKSATAATRTSNRRRDRIKKAQAHADMSTSKASVPHGIAASRTKDVGTNTRLGHAGADSSTGRFTTGQDAIPQSSRGQVRAPSTDATSRPGAHAVQGPGISVAGDSTNVDAGNMTVQEADSQNVDIPTAFLVEDDDDATAKDIVRAVETRRMMSRRNIICVAIAIIILVTGVVLGVVFGLTKPDSDTDTADFATTPKSHTRLSLLNLIVSESESYSDGGAAAVTDPGSPQAAAYEWVWEDPNLATYSDSRIMERYALATLYMSTQGSAWNNKTGWLSYDPTISECAWAYVDCKFSNRVETIIMEKNNLVGTLPVEIFHHLTNIFELSLSNNIGLSGTLHEDLGTGLGWFRLHDTMISGTLPDMAFRRLTKLRSTHLYRNQLSGSIPSSIYNLDDLQVLRLNANDLTGSISSEIGKLLNLESLWLSGNRLTSSLPTELGELFRLDTVYLHRNDFDGAIPTELGRLKKLKDITFEGNAFTGSMPAEMCDLGLLMLTGSSPIAELPAHITCPVIVAHPAVGTAKGAWILRDTSVATVE